MVLILCLGVFVAEFKKILIWVMFGLWVDMALAGSVRAEVDFFPTQADYVWVSKASSTEGLQDYQIAGMGTLNSGKRHWGRAFADMGIILGVVETWYWVNWKVNASDWDYDLPFRDRGNRPFHKKLTDGWKFDSNTFWVNFFGHTYGGVFPYQVGRANGFNCFESLLFGFAGSLFWEYIGEIQERVSFNDMIVTPLGGALLGEALHQTSLLLERKMRKGFLRSTVTFVLDPFRKINEFWAPPPKKKDRRTIGRGQRARCKGMGH